MVLSQEDQPGEHLSQRKTALILGICRRSVQNIVKKDLHLKSVKRLRTPQSNAAARNRRLRRARELLRANTEASVRRMCFQDEKDFTLQVPLNRQNNRCYTQGTKRDIPIQRLCQPTNKFSQKLMVSCCVSYQGVTQPFFVNPQRSKVNGVTYTEHLQNDLLPGCTNMYPRGNFIFVQDGAPSHTSATCQGYLQAALGKRFLTKDHWPPNSPDCNPLDYYFWNEISTKVYEGRREPFKDLNELRERILTVWAEATRDRNSLRRAIDQFLPRLRAVVQKKGYSIKSLFG